MPHDTPITHIYKPLLPLAWLYNIGVWTRNKLFDRGILSVEEFSVPVISVGNLTVGGTGKTPMIEYLIRLLSPHKRIAVLSRGYRRKSKGYVQASPHTRVHEIGDEPYQIYCKFPQVTVAVDSNRRRGIKMLLQQAQPPEVILLDDAHQHRYVKPTLSIVLCDYNRPIYADYLLPAGRLREPLSGLQRADIVVMTKCPHRLTQEECEIEANLLNYNKKQLYASGIQYEALRQLATGREVDCNTIEAQQEIILITGIANPRPMIEYLQQYTTHIIVRSYPDHHNFTTHEIEQLAQLAQKHKAIIVTTEKDAARLNAMTLPETIAKSCYILPITHTIHPMAWQKPLDKVIKEKAGIL